MNINKKTSSFLPGFLLISSLFWIGFSCKNVAPNELEVRPQISELSEQDTLFQIIHTLMPARKEDAVDVYLDDKLFSYKDEIFTLNERREVTVTSENFLMGGARPDLPGDSHARATPTKTPFRTLFIPGFVRGKTVKLTLRRAGDMTDDGIRYEGNISFPVKDGLRLYILKGIDPNKLDILPVVSKRVPPVVSKGTFKLRVINLYSYLLDGRGESVSLRYQDGTPVTGLSNVAYGRASDYVEIPVGSYQFKAYDILNNIIYENTFLQRVVGSTKLDLYEDKYHQIFTGRLGGTYTLVLRDATINASFFTDEENQKQGARGNGRAGSALLDYEWINESDYSRGGIQEKYGTLQIAHAHPDYKRLKVFINNNEIGEGIDYLRTTKLVSLPADQPIVISLSDESGEIYKTEYQVPNQSQIVGYLVPTSDGKATLAFYNYPAPNFGNENAASDRARAEAAIRFINLSPDVGQVSFMQNFTTFQAGRELLVSANRSYLDGAIDFDRYIYLENIGISRVTYNALPEFPIIEPSAYTIRASTEFPSVPGEALGIPMEIGRPGAPFLLGSAQVAGLYTVALVGRQSDNTTRLVIYKHSN